MVSRLDKLLLGGLKVPMIFYLAGNCPIRVALGPSTFRIEPSLSIVIEGDIVDSPLNNEVFDLNGK